MMFMVKAIGVNESKRLESSLKQRMVDNAMMQEENKLVFLW